MLGGGLLLAGGWLFAQALGHRPVGAEPSARRTLEAALEALLPEGTPRADVLAVADGIDTFLAGSDPILGGQLRLALGVLEHAGGAGPLSFARFSRLPVERRREVLEGWRTSALGPKRQIADAVRRVALFAWYTRSETWAALGYDGPWVGR